MSISSKKLLIYIPAYFDYESAMNQANLIKSERDTCKVEIQIAISVNAAPLSNEEKVFLENSCDDFVYFSENLGGDTNINLGYLKALSTKADFFWILSANDLLIPGGIKEISDALDSCSADLLIIHNEISKRNGSIDNVFIGEATTLPIGLISAVIYKVDAFRQSFASALKFAWTGWGQLSVIQNSIFDHGKISYEIINQEIIYNRRPTASISQQRITNQSYYRHSFFGYPLVASLLFDENRVIIKVQAERNNVTVIFPVKFAPPGRIGINPRKLLKRIKKKIVNK